MCSRDCSTATRCIARVDKRFDGYYTLQFMARGGLELYYGDERHELKGAWFWTAQPGPRTRVTRHLR